jgi:hypothetical protein
MRRPRNLILIAMAAVAIGGCRADDTTRAADAVHGFLSALERADGAAACHRLAEAGVSELLLGAVRANVAAEGLGAPGAEHCAIIAARLASGVRDQVAQLRRSPVADVAVDGETATVRTDAGAYEAREVDGRWRVARLDPVLTVLAGGAPERRPVHLTIVRPRLDEPALGAALAGRTDEAQIEISGSVEPGDASVRVVRALGARLHSVVSRDGRFQIRVALRRGTNRLLLEASAPARETIELAVTLTRGPVPSAGG